MLLAASPGPARLVSAHGQAGQRDVLLAMTIPACRLLAVAGVRHHGVVLDLHLADAWRRFAQEALLGDALPADGVWPPPPVPLNQPAADCPG